MYWNGKDIELFVTQKEFIDTVIVPLTKLTGAIEQIKQSATAAEFLISLTTFLEQQFKGRVVMMSPMIYTATMNQGEILEKIHEELEIAGFKYIYFMTTDPSWTEKNDQYNILWLPSIPLASMDQKMKQAVLSDQLRQIIPILSQKWI